MPLSEMPQQCRAKTWDIIVGTSRVGEAGRCSPTALGGNSWYLYKKLGRVNAFIYFKTKRELIAGVTKWLASYANPKKT